MLLFEFFPLFVTLVSIVAGLWLFMLNLEADADPQDTEPAERHHPYPPTAATRKGERQSL